MLHTGQWGEFRVMNTILCLHILFWYVFFFCFLLKKFAFIIFISLFDEVPNFRKRILTNQKPELVKRNCQWNCMQAEVQNYSLPPSQGLTSISCLPYVPIVP